MRNTKDGKDSGHTGRCVPLSEDPDMIALKKLVKQLEPDRREQLIDDMLDAAEQEGSEDDAEETD